MATYWDTEKIYFDGDLYFEDLLVSIDQAKELITIEVYIFSNDQFGNIITDHLIKAHQRGVDIQIIADGVGSWDILKGLYQRLTSSGIQIKLYNPLPFIHPYYGKLTFFKKIEYFLLRFWRLNRRNHRKLITIDEQILFTGSYNFTAEHTQLHKENKWKDMGARVTGHNVRLAILNFKKIWKIREYYVYRKKIKLDINKNITLNALRISQSVLSKRFYYRDLLKKFGSARQRIWLITPYFIPSGKVIKFLVKAAQRGIDTRLLISYKTDIKIFRTLQYFYYPYLIKNGVKIFLFKETVLHAKNFIIDDWMTIGSSNLNHRSLLHDLEVDLVIEDEDNKTLIHEHFIEITSSLQELTMADLDQRTLWDKFLSRILFLFKYWF